MQTRKVESFGKPLTVILAVVLALMSLTITRACRTSAISASMDAETGLLMEVTGIDNQGIMSYRITNRASRNVVVSYHFYILSVIAIDTNQDREVIVSEVPPANVDAAGLSTGDLRQIQPGQCVTGQVSFSPIKCDAFFKKMKTEQPHRRLAVRMSPLYQSLLEDDAYNALNNSPALRLTVPLEASVEWR